MYANGNGSSPTFLAVNARRTTVKKDEFFGRQIVYRNKTVVALPVKSDGATPLTLTADLQGCADLGVCYPPVRRTFLLTPSGR